MNNAIELTTGSLKSQAGLLSEQHRSTFVREDVPDSSLYRDEIHLNPKGGQRLGKNINKKLCEILHIQYPTLLECETLDINNHPNGDCGTGRNNGRRNMYS